MTPLPSQVLREGTRQNSRSKASTLKKITQAFPKQIQFLTVKPLNLHPPLKKFNFTAMETLRDAYRDEEDEDTTEKSNNGNGVHPTPTSTTPSQDEDTNNNHNPELLQIKEEEQSVSDELSEAEATEEDEEEEEEEEEEEDEDLQLPQSKLQKRQQLETPIVDLDEEDEEEDNTPRKKQKPLSSFTTEQTPQTQTMPLETVVVGMQKIQALTTPVVKKPKKKKSKNNNNVWTKPTSRKGKKKTKSNAFGNVVGSVSASAADEDKVLITPVPRFPDRSDDSSDLNICLSKVYKAEKVELSDDRLTAGSSKGYRMVRATRGVVEGAWYFEIKVAKLGETGHTRLGWSMEKGDLQAPVGYDANSFGYRDIDGCKIHKAMREKYGEEGYVEGDVIGFYINLPDGSAYAPKLPQFVWYKGQRYMCAADGKEESQKVVPGSEISFFKNGVCQGVAFKDLYGGRYYPAASMYTLPNQPNCTVKFNFGPDFEYFPQDFDECPIPKPMIEVPYHGFDGKVENGETDEKEE